MINRREFLRISGLTAAVMALAACSPSRSFKIPALATGTSEPTIQPDDVLIPRALRRILFAPTPDDLTHAQFIEEQLAPETIPDPDLGSHLATYETLGMDPAQLSQVTPVQKPGLQLVQATLVRAVYSQCQLYELMVDFWSNHFNIYLDKGGDKYLKTIDDRQVIRPNALGSFPALLSASAHSPAMLIYLDNALSNKSAPNENYARELMELHTVSVDAGYTQGDVHEVARALTGWTISGARTQNPGSFLFDAKTHDDGAKMILGVNFPASQGIKDGEQLLSILGSAPSTAQFISRKLVQRFVADDPPASLVASAAATFSKTGGHITKVMGVILHSPEFKTSLGLKIKRPFEFIVSAIRASGAAFKPDLPTMGMLDLMGQPPFGWESPNGFPDAAGAWITTNGVLSRWNYALAMASNALKDTQVDASMLVPGPANNADGIDALSIRLLGERLPDLERQIIVDFAGNSPFNTQAPALMALILATSDFFYR